MIRSVRRSTVPYVIAGTPFSGSAELAALLSSSEGVTRLVQEPGTGTYRVTTARPESVIPEIYRHAERLGVTVSSIYISETTLEDAFINLVTENHGAGVVSGGRAA